MIITREQGQSMVVEMYKKLHALVCYYCTGFGKCKAALEAVKSDGFDPGNPLWSGLIIVHSQPSRDFTWPDEIRKWAYEYFHCIGEQITIICYQSLHKYKGKHFDWVIGDEFHRIAEVSGRHLKEITSDGYILLTATRPEETFKRDIIRTLAKGNKLTIKLDTAIESKVLNDYRIRVWRVAMQEFETLEYHRLCIAVNKAKRSGHDLFIKKTLGERARFIYNLESKYQAACWIRDNIRAKNKRFVMHCGSIAMANRLSPYTFHSLTSDINYKKFLIGEIDEIASIKQIKEGSNIERLESALIVQVLSKEIHLIQEIGRNMRLRPDEIAILHLLVAKDTVDENWQESAAKNLDKAKISYHDIDYEKIKHYT